MTDDRNDRQHDKPEYTWVPASLVARGIAQIITPPVLDPVPIKWADDEGDEELFPMIYSGKDFS